MSLKPEGPSPSAYVRGRIEREPFSDLKNVQVADLMSDWLKAKGLDVR